MYTASEEAGATGLAFSRPLTSHGYPSVGHHRDSVIQVAAAPVNLLPQINKSYLPFSPPGGWVE